MSILRLNDVQVLWKTSFSIFLKPILGVDYSKGIHEMHCWEPPTKLLH
jgi:hypothetical protein